jgi:hypothetical protein
MLEGASEDLLEDVLRVVGAQAEPLRRDGIDVAREAVDELRPGALVAGAAAGDQRRVGKRCFHGREDNACLRRLVGVHPETHRAYVRERHLDLLRRARSGELAADLAAGRRAERRMRATALLRAGRRLAPGAA